MVLSMGLAVGKKEHLYAWEGKNQALKMVRGENYALGENQLRANLRRKGISVTKIKKQRSSARKKIKGRDIATFTRQHSTLLRAGVPMLQAIEIVGRGHSNASVSKLLLEVKTDVESGSSLSQALRKHPRYFDGLYCNLIEAGETAGILETMLERLATYKEKMEAMKSQIFMAMLYPIGVIFLALLILTGILVYVIPVFKETFANANIELPLLTLMVVGMSDFMVEHFMTVVLGFFGSIFFIRFIFKRSKPLQRGFDRVKLNMPVFGDLLNMTCLARWSRTLSTMFAAGVPLVESLASVGGAAGNHIYAQATQEIQTNVSTGVSLANAMYQTNKFPNILMQMTSIGEESGSLDTMLDKVAQMYEQDVERKIAGLSSLLEPFLIVILGIMIGGLVIAMYLPIFKMGQAV